MNNEILIGLGEVSEETKGCPAPLQLEGGERFNFKDVIEPPCEPE